jgi:hypothetical protein
MIMTAVRSRLDRVVARLRAGIARGTYARDTDGRPCDPCSPAAAAWSLAGAAMATQTHDLADEGHDADPGVLSALLTACGGAGWPQAQLDQLDALQRWSDSHTDAAIVAVAESATLIARTMDTDDAEWCGVCRAPIQPGEPTVGVILGRRTDPVTAHRRCVARCRSCGAWTDPDELLRGGWCEACDADTSRP